MSSKNMQTGLPALITGANGFLGRWLVPTLTAAGRPVVAALRNHASRTDELRRWTAEHGGRPGLVTTIEHDLLQPFDPDEALVAGVVDVFHLAAVFAWNLDPTAASRANVDGALEVLRWAASRPRLRRFVLIAGYRVASDGPGAAGGYESSKRRQRALLLEEAERLGVPLTVIDPSAVMGDSRTGETTQYIGPAELLQLLFARRLPVLPGRSDTFLPLVPVDDVARFAAAVPEDPDAAGRAYVLLDDTTPVAPELVRMAARHLGVPGPRLTVPVGLVRRLPRWLTGASPETLEFLSTDRYDVSSARAFARRHGLADPDAAAALPAWLDALVARRFGAAPAPSALPAHMEAGVWVRRFGEGEPSLLLHGPPLDGDAWNAVVGSLPGRRIVPDLPGLGRSGNGDPFDPAWLDCLTGALGTPAVVVGHSLGAGLAVELAHRHPDRVRALVLVVPAFLQGRPALWMRARAVVRVALALARRGKLAASLHPDGLAHPAVASALAMLDRRGAAAAVARSVVLDQARHPRVRELMAELRVPVWIIAGERDPIEGAPSNWTLEIVPGAGRNPMLTHPAQVTAVIRRAAAATSCS